MYTRIGVPVRIRRKNKQTLGPTFVQSIRFSSGLLWLCIRSSARSWIRTYVFLTSAARSKCCVYGRRLSLFCWYFHSGNCNCFLFWM